ncbi:MAG TPA: hypothetical protein VJ908_04025 [Wenzhouxiangellaceae bacterium]|nr:hypothetical protein [Wenzhouxiangellaceae bacterium]
MTGQSSNIEFGSKPNKALIWIASTACVLFAIPLVAMQFTREVNWDGTDFVAWGLLLFVAGGVCLLVTRKLPRSTWLGAGVLIGVLFVYVWAELAVGIFTNIGS